MRWIAACTLVPLLSGLLQVSVEAREGFLLERTYRYTSDHLTLPPRHERQDLFLHDERCPVREPTDLPDRPSRLVSPKSRRSRLRACHLLLCPSQVEKSQPCRLQHQRLAPKSEFCVEQLTTDDELCWIGFIFSE